MSVIPLALNDRILCAPPRSRNRQRKSRRRRGLAGMICLDV
jgi:hypothetical protein